MLRNTPHVRGLLFFCLWLPATGLMLWNFVDSRRTPLDHPDYIDRSILRSRLGYFGATLMLLAGAIPGAMDFHVFWKKQRRRRRIREGLCGECGYDLRGAEGRCPECGADRPTAPAG